MDLELISFKICPFVQRAVITLLYTETPYRVTYIDISSPPDWFKAISPFGKVPVLKIDNSHVIFESAVIDEYLNDVHCQGLLPRDPLLRAIDRSWIDFGSNLLLDFSGLIHATTAEKYNQQLDTVKKQIHWLEKKLGEGPYFNGEAFSLVDIAYAPLFMRAEILGLNDQLYPENTFPNVSSWAGKLLTIKVLPGSVVSDFEDVLKNHIKQKAAFAASQFGL
jgi:glutathione S-transferase